MTTLVFYIYVYFGSILSSYDLILPHTEQCSVDLLHIYDIYMTYFADTNTLNHRLMRSALSVLIFSVLWLSSQKTTIRRFFFFFFLMGVWTDTWNKMKILEIEKSNKRAYVLLILILSYDKTAMLLPT